MTARDPNRLGLGRIVVGLLESAPQDSGLVGLRGLRVPQMVARDGLGDSIPLYELERLLDGDSCDGGVRGAERAEDTANEVASRERSGGVVKHDVLSVDQIEGGEERLPTTPYHGHEMRVGAERRRIVVGTNGDDDRPAACGVECVEGPRDEGPAP